MSVRANRHAWLWTNMSADQRGQCMSIEGAVERSSSKRCNAVTRLHIAERVFTGVPVTAAGLTLTLTT